MALHMIRVLMRLRSSAFHLVIAIAIVLLLTAIVCGADTGNLKLDVMGDIGAGATNQAELISPEGKVVAKVTPGATVAVAPGVYRLRLPIIGGEIDKPNIKIEAGRTRTVMIDNVAVMNVSVKDKTGKDPGLGVSVTTTDPPHNEIASFITGETVLFAPNMVDVKVDAPPQGYSWHAIRLEAGKRSRLTLSEVVPAELLVQPILAKNPIPQSTRVIVYRAGTQSQVEVSPPSSEHRIKLDPGDYDVYVENNSGKGRATASLNGIHLDSGAKVEREVPLD